MSPESLISRVVRWLAARTWATVFALFFAWFVLWTAFAYILLNEIVSGTDQKSLASLSSSLMTAFGALFAFLTAFVITIEWNQRRDAEHNIGLEADSWVRLAWASQFPDADGTSVRRSLRAYGRAVLDVEWPILGRGEGGAPEAHDRLGEVQELVRTVAAQPGLPVSVSTDFTKALNAMAVTRSDRINASTHDLPVPLFLLSLLAGVMLTLNAICVALTFEPEFVFVIGGLVTLVSLDLALLVSISTPYLGGLHVRRRPLAHVIEDLERERYGPL